MKKQRINNQIRRLRFEANEMTQAELAEKASVTRQTIIAVSYTHLTLPTTPYV